MRNFKTLILAALAIAACEKDPIDEDFMIEDGLLDNIVVGTTTPTIEITGTVTSTTSSITIDDLDLPDLNTVTQTTEVVSDTVAIPATDTATSTQENNDNDTPSGGGGSLPVSDDNSSDDDNQENDDNAQPAESETPQPDSNDDSQENDDAPAQPQPQPEVVVPTPDCEFEPQVSATVNSVDVYGEWSEWTPANAESNVQSITQTRTKFHDIDTTTVTTTTYVLVTNSECNGNAPADEVETFTLTLGQDDIVETRVITNPAYEAPDDEEVVETCTETEYLYLDEHEIIAGSDLFDLVKSEFTKDSDDTSKEIKKTNTDCTTDSVFFDFTIEVKEYDAVLESELEGIPASWYTNNDDDDLDMVSRIRYRLKMTTDSDDFAGDHEVIAYEFTVETNNDPVEEIVCTYNAIHSSEVTNTDVVEYSDWVTLPSSDDNPQFLTRERIKTTYVLTTTVSTTTYEKSDASCDDKDKVVETTNTTSDFNEVTESETFENPDYVEPVVVTPTYNANIKWAVSGSNWNKVGEKTEITGTLDEGVYTMTIVIEPKSGYEFDGDQSISEGEMQANSDGSIKFTYTHTLNADVTKNINVTISTKQEVDNTPAQPNITFDGSSTPSWVQEGSSWILKSSAVKVVGDNDKFYLNTIKGSSVTYLAKNIPSSGSFAWDFGEKYGTNIYVTGTVSLNSSNELVIAYTVKVYNAIGDGGFTIKTGLE